MFSKKAVNPYDFLSHAPTSQTIRNRIGVIRNHFEFNEKLNLDDRRQLLVRIENSDHEVEREHYEIELHFHEHFFERVHRVSTLLIIYSLLENLMAKICNDKSQKKYQVNSQIDGYGILSFKTYLEKQFDINFSDQKIEKHWSKIKTLNKLRNALAHSEGDLEQYGHFSVEQCTKLKKTIGSTKGLSLYSNTIMITEKYVIDSLDAVEKFLLAIK
ncbi:hypothetical protein [Aliivibrio fischeri]|uniref:hypothetical protein n=1 Tax=Aliivibrio fischeri TaxID=668 RepID=UPI0007C450A6|nr:hypothetical protein [Aliivibrio fischeri]